MKFNTLKCKISGWPDRITIRKKKGEIYKSGYLLVSVTERGFTGRVVVKAEDLFELICRFRGN